MEKRKREEQAREVGVKMKKKKENSL